MAARTPEQTAAIGARERDVFLEAGAGTGKTGVLVDRYCDAVGEDGVAPDQILAFTFTERAAGELRSRIRSELLRRAAEARERGEAERAAELARFARDSEAAWISTIHGFCRRLLASHPLAAGLDPRFRVIDEAEADRIAERAFGAALEELALARESAALTAAGFQPVRLRELVRSAHEGLRGQGIEPPSLPPVCPPPGGDGEERPPADELRQTGEAYAAIRELLDGFASHYERLKASRSGLDFEDLQLRAVALLRDSPAIREHWQGRFRHLLVDEFQDTNRLQVSLIDALRGPGTRLFTVGDEFQSIYGFRDADLEVFRAERARAEERPEEQHVVLPLSGNFRSRPEILAAVNAIGAALLGAGFRPLTAGTEEHPPAPSSPPAVELALTRVGGWNEDGIELESAADSAPSRIAEARALAARLRELVDGGVDRGDIVVLLRAFTHVGAFEEALERAGLAPYVVGGRGYWSHQQVEDAICLLSAIANPLDDERLLGALASPACAVSADTLWLLRRIAGEDPPRHIWPALARRFGPRGAERSAAADSNGAGAVAGADAQPAGDPQPALFDASPSGEAEAEREAAERERERERYTELVPAEDGERLRRFCATLAELRAAAPLLSLEELVERVVAAFRYDLAALSRDGGTRRIANLRKLMRLAREFEAGEGRDLRGFLDHAAEQAGREAREGQAATEAEGVDGVRVMSVHAAKGLEFPVVAVADLGRSLTVGGRPPDIRVEPADDGTGEAGELRLGLRVPRPGQESLTLGELDALTDEAVEAEAAEALRLAYVAATRAERQLILSGTYNERELEPREDPPHSLPVTARLLAALELDTEEDRLLSVPGPAARPGLDAEFPPGEIAVSFNLPSPERAAQLSARSGSGEDEPGPAGAAGGRPPLAELREPPPRAAVTHLSYSALSDFARCGYRFYAERLLGLGRLDESDPTREATAAGEEPDVKGGERERGFAFGSAVHALLEWSARNRWSAPPAGRFEAALRQEGLEPNGEDLERARRMVGRFLDSELRRRLDGRMVRLHPEAPFLLSLAGTVVRGKIDLLAELPGGELVVLDYKTDALGASTPEGLMPRYETQRAVYALAAHDGRLARDGDAAGEPDVLSAYAFLDGDGAPVERRYDAAALAAARAGLEGLVARIRDGEFEVTDRPHRGLCLDCPARQHLCSHPPERTLASAPAQPALGAAGGP